MKKRKNKKITLLPDQAKLFFSKLVETAPEYLYFLDEDTRKNVIDQLQKKLCTGEPVVLDAAEDLVVDCFNEVQEEVTDNV